MIITLKITCIYISEVCHTEIEYIDAKIIKINLFLIFFSPSFLLGLQSHADPLIFNRLVNASIYNQRIKYVNFYSVIEIFFYASLM